MKMNTKVRYGLRAMIEISSNIHSPGILQKEISSAQEIPLKYLDSIITGLRNAGLIINYAGKRSGYILTRPPVEISVYDIYRAFEPELTLVNCACPGNECSRINICPAKDYWFELSTVIKDQMKSTTLDQLVKRKEFSIDVN
jgi:Rrf2 family protein